MNLRSFNIKDYFIIAEWWTKHNWPVIPIEMLPKIGLIIDNYCAGFLYQTDSKVALLEFVIANPDTNKEERAKSLDILIEGLINTAKELGYTRIFTSVNHPKLLERYKNHKFEVTDSNMFNLIRTI